MIRDTFAFSAAFAVLLVAAGCLQTESQVPAGPTAEQAAAARAEYLQAEAAESTQTVVETIASLGSSEPAEVTVVGVLGGMPNPYDQQSQPDFPWRAGEASFFLVDPATAAEFEGDHGHAPGEECSFCLGKARDMVDTVAMVQLAGDAPKFQADQLLGLEEDSTVAVTGKAKMLADMLVVNATKIHVMKPDQLEIENAEVVDQ